MSCRLRERGPFLAAPASRAVPRRARCRLVVLFSETRQRLIRYTAPPPFWTLPRPPIRSPLLHFCRPFSLLPTFQKERERERKRAPRTRQQKKNKKKKQLLLSVPPPFFVITQKRRSFFLSVVYKGSSTSSSSSSSVPPHVPARHALVKEGGGLVGGTNLHLDKGGAARLAPCFGAGDLGGGRALPRGLVVS